MKRQIEFRGEPMDAKMWVYGFYYRIGNRHYILTKKGKFIRCWAKTIGQFSGFVIKNQRVYEGDVISLRNVHGVMIEAICQYGINKRVLDSGEKCDIPSFYLAVQGGKKPFNSYPIIKNYKGVHDLEISEIVGNIHDVE